MTLEATAQPRWPALAAHRGIVWQFDKSGTVDFACLMPGHVEAGMTGRFVVNP